MQGEVGVDLRLRRRIGALLAGTAVLVLVLALPGAAHATCYSSTASSITFTDPLSDSLTGPDIGDTTITLDGACGISVDPAVTGLDSTTKGLFVFVDTDGDFTTGDGFGAEESIIVLGDPTSPGPPVLVPWNGTAYDFNQAQVLPGKGAAGFRTTLDQLGVKAPTTLAFGLASLNSATLDGDSAPDTDAYYFPVSFSTSPPPPPPPPPPPAPPVTPKAPATVQKKAGCTVPKIKGKSVSKAKRALAAAGCKYKIKGTGKVVSTNPKAGTQTSDTVQVKAKKKKKRKGYVRKPRRIEGLDRALRAAGGR